MKAIPYNADSYESAYLMDELLCMAGRFWWLAHFSMMAIVDSAADEVFCMVTIHLFVF